MANEKREVQCPVCKKHRMVTRRNKYDNVSFKICRPCVPKAYAPPNVRRRREND